MTLTIIQFRGFRSEWKKAGLTDEDLQSLEQQLIAAPAAGPVIAGTAGLRKIRFAPPSMHSGKRGAYRVCYAWFDEYQRVYLITFYGKNEKSNLTPAERNVIRDLLRRLSERLAVGENP